MVEVLKSLLASNQAKKVIDLKNDLTDLDQALTSIILLGEEGWQGKSYNAFYEAILDIKRDVHNLKGALTEISEDIIRVSRNCAQQEALLAEAQSRDSSGDGHGGGFSTGGFGKGGGFDEGGGGRF
ncbi:MAG: WXG100 family type VII secretion target [Oscillospiraceae bacterium]|nr:WXG100 family type VII secretion target [Oscillospiraceae bacterium]